MTSTMMSFSRKKLLANVPLAATTVAGECIPYALRKSTNVVEEELWSRASGTRKTKASHK
jgi:hypothetical protein